MRTVCFPFNSVPCVQLPAATLLRDAPRVRQFIEKEQVDDLRMLLQGYGLSPLQHLTAVEQFGVGLTLDELLDEPLDEPLDREAFARMRTYFVAFRSIEQNAHRMPERRAKPVSAAEKLSHRTKALQESQEEIQKETERTRQSLALLTQQFFDLNERLDRHGTQIGAEVAAKQTLQALMELRIDYRNRNLLGHEVPIPDDLMPDWYFLIELRDETFSHLRRNLERAFPPHVKNYLSESEKDGIAAQALYRMRGPSAWADAVKASYGVLRSEPREWRLDSSFWPGDCLKELHVLAEDCAAQRVGELPSRQRTKAQLRRWWQRRQWTKR